jgi:glutamate--cysteine ligase
MPRWLFEPARPACWFRRRDLSDPTTTDVPVRGIEDLLRPFLQAQKPEAEFRIGTEAEKFGVLADTFEPLPFDGPRSVRRVLELLAERHGWQQQREHDQGEVIALVRGDASVTLEPAGQLELSGAPFASMHDTAAEFAAHMHELHGLSGELGIVWLSLGFHPFARQADLPHVPKLRYAVMERYLPTRGPRALDMMRRTCTVQANLDYSSEQDAVRKLRVSLAVQPIATALFANSPFLEGRRGPNLSERAAVWIGMDPDRSGLLPFAWERDLSFRAYIEWALDVPMFLIKRGNRVISNTGQTFRTFMVQGAEGERATLADWETHLNTLFPETRLKKTIEVRGADAQPSDLLCALPALWKGLLYDATALARLESLIAPLDAKTVDAARPEIARIALRAQLAGRSLQRWAEDVVDIARAGLARHAVRDAQGRDETLYLQPLQDLLAHGKTPADRLLEAASAAEGSPAWRARIIERARV